MTTDTTNVRQIRQKAFRERKDQHLKSLESEVTELEIAHEKLAAENERLKQQIRTILALIPASSISFKYCGSDGPLTSTYVSKGCQTEATSDYGDCFNSEGAACDFIINHELYNESHVDVDDVIVKLKHRAHSYLCVPLFTGGAIMDALRQSVEQKSGEPFSSPIHWGTY